MKRSIKQIANERIEILYDLSKKYLFKNKELSKYYISLIKELRKKYHPKLKKEIKYFICKRCCLPLVPGVNATIRLKHISPGKTKIIIKCKNCNYVKRVIVDKNVQKDDGIADKTKRVDRKKRNQRRTT